MARRLLRHAAPSAAALAALLAPTALAAPVGGDGSGQTVLRGPAPAPTAIPGGLALIGRPISAGTPLPASVALVTRTVALPAHRRRATVRVARLRCPAGTYVSGLFDPVPPRRGDAGSVIGYADGARSLFTNRVARIRYAVAAHAPAGSALTLGTVCQTSAEGSKAFSAGDRSPYGVPGVVGRGARLGRGAALVTRVVALPAHRHGAAGGTVAVACPAGLRPGALFDPAGRGFRSSRARFARAGTHDSSLLVRWSGRPRLPARAAATVGVACRGGGR